MIIGLFLALTSCYKDGEIVLDSKQPSSKITSDLIITTINASSFIDSKTQQERLIHIDTTSLDIVSADFLIEELIKTNLSFQFKNSMNSDFRIEFEFLNDRNEVKFEFQIPVSAGTKEKPVVVETSVIIESSELTNFKESTKLVYKVIFLHSDKPLSRDSIGVLELHSNATYLFDI